MSSGAKVVAAFIRETTPGITPTAGAWNLLRRSSFGLKPTQNTNDNDEIAGDRMAQGVSRAQWMSAAMSARGFAGTSMMIFLPAASVPNG